MGAPVGTIGTDRVENGLGGSACCGEVRVEDATIGTVRRTHDLVANVVERTPGAAIGGIGDTRYELRLAPHRAHAHDVPELVPDDAAPVPRLTSAARHGDLLSISAPARVDVLPSLPRQALRRAATGAHLPQVSADRILPTGERDKGAIGRPGRSVLEGSEALRRQAPRRPVRQLHHPHPPHRLEGQPPPVGRGALPAGELHRERVVALLRLGVGELGNGALHLGREGDCRHHAARHVETPQLSALRQHDGTAIGAPRVAGEVAQHLGCLEHVLLHRIHQQSFVPRFEVAEPERRARAEGVPLPGDRSVGDATHEGKPLAVGRDLGGSHPAARGLQLL